MSIEDSLIRRQIFLIRFAGARAIEAEEMLLRILENTQARLLREPTEIQAGRLARLITDIQILTGQGFDELNEKIIADALELANDEVEFSAKALNQEVTVETATPAIAQIQQAVLREGMDAPIGPKTITMQEALNQFSAKKSVEIQRTISDGILEGKTTPQIARDVGALSNRQRPQVNALVRTNLNHSGSQARKAFSKENAEILKGDEWVATLDSSTTLICGGRDGIIYPIGKGPFPPAHWNACCEDVLITTDRGQVPIQDVKVGDYALTHTGEFKKVYAVMAKPHKGKIIELTNNFRQSTRLTHDHPILTIAGYKPASVFKSANASERPNVFNNFNKLNWFKLGYLRSLVEQSILLDSHNIETKCSESLVTYKVGSFATGVSSAIELNKDILNPKVGNVFPSVKLMLNRHVDKLKIIYHKLLMKCRIGLKGLSQ